MTQTMKRNLLVLALLAALIAVVFLMATQQDRQLNPTGGDLGPLEPLTSTTPLPEATAVPAAQTEADAPTEEEVSAVPDRAASTTASDTTKSAAADASADAAPHTTNAPADAYLVVTVAGTTYNPIPLYKPGRYTIKRGDHINVVEVSENSIMMKESSCDNQDCVYQGVVTLENRSTRVLQNAILCLPNEVMLELYTQEEVVDMMLHLAEEADAVE